MTRRSPRRVFPHLAAFCPRAAGAVTFGLIGIVGSVLSVGCDGGKEALRPTATRLPAIEALGSEIDGAVVAQGTLEPARGVLPVMGPVGDRLVELSVSEGDTVEAGEELGRVRSLEVRSQELRVARTQLEEARGRTESERRVSEAKLEVARVELSKAELQLKQAEERFDRSEADGGRLDLLREAVELAENRLEQLREASRDSGAGRLVRSSDVNQQELEVRQARASWEAARQEAVEGIESGKLSVEAAGMELKAAELTAEAGQSATPLESLEQKVELLELQLEAIRLVSPIDGKVLSVDVTPGESLSTRPIAHVADTSEMVCRAEVNVADLGRISVGREARVSSPALSRPLSGTVRSISRMVGAPKLPSPSPMARVDWRSAEVVIEIRGEDVPLAAELVRLQVDVAIAADPFDGVSASEATAVR